MDGIDRYTVDTDIISTTSGTSITWYVWENEVTGAEMLHFEDTNSTSWQYQHKEIWFSPEGGFTGGGAGVRPTATDEISVNGNGTDWLGHGYWKFTCGRAKDAIKNGALIPWDGNQNVMDWSRSTGDVNTIAVWSDNAQMRATFDKDGLAGGPYLAAMYMGAESYISATVMENFIDWRDELANEYIITPMSGLICTTVGIRGRHGRLADVWITNARTDLQVPQGSTFPADGTHQFVKIGQFVYPWAGVPMYVI